MGFLMALYAESNQILTTVISQAAARLDMMDLKILRPPARLATPAVSLQYFLAKLAISFGVKFKAWPLRPELGQGATWRACRSCRN